MTGMTKKRRREKKRCGECIYFEPNRLGIGCGRCGILKETVMEDDKACENFREI